MSPATEAYRRFQTLQPRAGFDWAKVQWSPPTAPPPTHCSYCYDKLPSEQEDAHFAELIIWNDASWCAMFCTRCQRDWWGARV
jgi:hypothetical protein